MSSTGTSTSSVHPHEGADSVFALDGEDKIDEDENAALENPNMTRIKTPSKQIESEKDNEQVRDPFLVQIISYFKRENERERRERKEEKERERHEKRKRKREKSLKRKRKKGYKKKREKRTGHTG